LSEARQLNPTHVNAENEAKAGYMYKMLLDASLHAMNAKSEYECQWGIVMHANEMSP
jgi:hypothetical protein